MYETSPKNYEWFWKGLDRYLEKNQLKQTKQRKIIVSYFLGMKNHVDAEELYEVVRKEGHNIGLATIYRTLGLLKDAKLIKQNSFADGRFVYEILEPGQHHDHLVCIKCGEVVEFINDRIEILQEEIAIQKGYKLVNHRLDLFGYCSRCQQ